MTPQNHDDLAADLERVLRDRADGIAGTPIDLADVKGRARGIRRRQAAAAGLGVAAVLAVAVPLGLGAGGVLGGASPEPGPATNTATDTAPPTPSESAVQPVPSDPRPMDFSDLEQGPPPAVVWADGGQVRADDVVLGDLSAHWPFDSVTPLGESFVVTSSAGEGEGERGDGEGRVARVVDATGSEISASPIEGGVAASPGGNVVGYAAPDGGITLLQDGGRVSYTAPPVAEAGPFHVAGVRGEDCGPEAPDGGCSVYVTTRGQEPATWVTGPDGPARQVKGVQTVTAVRGSLMAAITEVNADLSTCSRLLHVEGTRVADTCDHMVVGFSSNGRYALGYAGQFDGLGSPELALLDATDASPIVSLRSTEQHQGFVSTSVWEDDAHVLAVVHSDGEWGVIRFGIDGSLEWAVAPRPGSDAESPFLLADGR